MRMVRPLDVEPILEVITNARKNGAERLIFLGGEPTLQPGFFPALEHSSALGFSEIVIFTNGVRLGLEGFIDRCLSIGKFTWRISIQGANEAAHVAVTEKTNSFKRIIKGIRMLQERGQRVTANMCVTEASYRSLPDYPELVATYDIKQLHIDIVRPMSSGIRTPEYLRAIMPQYSLMAPYYSKMLEGFEETNPEFDINIGNLAYCIMPQWGHRIHHAGENTVTHSANIDGLDESPVNKYEVHNAQRVHMDKCAECAFRPRCTGVFTDYLEIYGEDEFSPVSLEALRGFDPNRNNFTILAAPLIEPLVLAAIAAPPAGWSIGNHFVDARSRRIELQLERSAGGGVVLYFAPLEGQGQVVDLPPVVMETSDYRVGLSVDGWYPEEELTSLLRWSESQLMTPAVEVVKPLDLDIARDARGLDPLVAHGRARMLNMVSRVQYQGRFNGWRYAGTTTRLNGNAVDVKVVGPEGMGVVLSIEVAIVEGRSKVDADFDLMPGTDPDVARPAVEAIVKTLRSAEKSRALRRR
jgi:MoaA/NifB/PqqE/SkfB family radical SAM enzyme